MVAGIEEVKVMVSSTQFLDGEPEFPSYIGSLQTSTTNPEISRVLLLMEEILHHLGWLKPYI